MLVTDRALPPVGKRSSPKSQDDEAEDKMEFHDISQSGR